MRLALTRDWKSRWYANKQDFGNLLKEDNLLRKIVFKKLEDRLFQIFISKGMLIV